MEKLVTSDFVPLKDGQLNWIFIDQPGKADLNGNMRLVAALYVLKDSEECNSLIAKIDEYWEDNKPTKSAKLKSAGYREAMVKDNDGEDQPMDPPMMSFSFWTGAKYKDGNPRAIDIYNAAGNKVSLGGKKIGNGSLGAISGQMDIYDQGVASRGVTLYLTAIQLLKFIPYESDAGFGASEAEEEGAFMGVDEELPETNGEDDGEAKPRL